MDPFRKVLDTEFYHPKSAPHGTGSHKFTLECGHVTYNKASQGFPKKRRCHECGHAERNARHAT